MTELVLSSTSADAYRRCGWMFYLEYVEVVPQAQNVRAAVGIAAHAAVEWYYRHRLRGASHDELWFQMEEIFDVFDAALTFELLAVAEPEEDTDKAAASGRRTVEAYIEDVAADQEPLYVEAPLRFDVNGIPYSIHPDLITKDLIVRDLKIKRSKPRDPGVYAFQQNGYAIGTRILTGRKEKDVVLDVMIRLLRDRPYHAPISNGGPISDYAEKLFATQLSQRVANAMLDLGGAGGQLRLHTAGAPLRGRAEMSYRYSVIDTIGGGASEIQKNIIARRKLGLPKNF